MPGGQRRFAVYVDKGGVAKTTSIGHIGRSMAEHHDLDVLLVDAAGRQNDLATLFGLGDEVSGGVEAPLSAIFREDWEFIRENIPDVVDRMVFETEYPGLSIIPSDPGLEGADNDLASLPLEERYDKLDEFVSTELDEYDVVAFDLPGKESNIALNGLVAAENVVATAKPGEFERRQVDQLPDVLTGIVADYPRELDLEIVMILPSAVDNQKNMHQEFVGYIEENYPDLVAPEVINNAVDIEESAKRGSTVFAVDDDDLYRTGKRARSAYRTVTTDLLERLDEQ